MNEKPVKKNEPATAIALLSMAEKLRSCAEDCEEAAEFLKIQKAESFPNVSVRTSQLRIAQIKAFVRKLNMHKETREDVIREKAGVFELPRRKKKN